MGKRPWLSELTDRTPERRDAGRLRENARVRSQDRSPARIRMVCAGRGENRGGGMIGRFPPPRPALPTDAVWNFIESTAAADVGWRRKMKIYDDEAFRRPGRAVTCVRQLTSSFYWLSAAAAVRLSPITRRATPVMRVTLLLLQVNERRRSHIAPSADAVNNWLPSKCCRTGDGPL